MITIVQATYGSKDCTIQVASKVRGNSFTLRSNNDIIGDPLVGTRKTLEVVLEDNGIRYTLLAPEGGLIIYPKERYDKLGIFYSNNITESSRPVSMPSSLKVFVVVVNHSLIVMNIL